LKRFNNYLYNLKLHAFSRIFRCYSMYDDYPLSLLFTEY